MPLLIAALASMVLTPLAIVAARHLGLVDRPGSLKLHAEPVPIGGVGVAVAAGLGVLVSRPSGWIWILMAIAMATATGLLDDVRPLPPLTRVVLQAAAGGALLAGGAEMQPLGGLGGAGLVIVTVAAVNAVNMLDGQDGLAPGLVAIAGIGLSLLGPGGAAAAAPLAAAGAALGFLPWNHAPARVFLGDAGAYALGVLLAEGVAEASSSGWPGLLAAGACLGVFAYELLSTVARRVVHRSSALAGDRDHAYDRLAARLGSRTASTYVMWAVGGGTVLIAWAVAELPPMTGALVIVGATAIAIAIHARLEIPVSEAER